MRGIVMAAGGRFAEAVGETVTRLRYLGCDLPIELWHLDGEEPPAAEGATVRNGGKHYNGWALKPYAVDASDFDEVLLLDADAEPMSDPSFLFDSPPYAETGALFWPDILRLREEAPIWNYLRLEPRAVVSLESGQLVIDKPRCRAAMNEVIRLTVDAPKVYTMLYGDKDTWLMAWLKAEQPYALCPHGPDWQPDAWYQHDWNGARLFRHPRS